MSNKAGAASNPGTSAAASSAAGGTGVNSSYSAGVAANDRGAPNSVTFNSGATSATSSAANGSSPSSSNFAAGAQTGGNATVAAAAAAAAAASTTSGGTSNFAAAGGTASGVGTSGGSGSTSGSCASGNAATGGALGGNGNANLNSGGGGGARGDPNATAAAIANTSTSGMGGIAAALLVGAPNYPMNHASYIAATRHDEAESFAAALIEEILHEAQEILFERYISTQVTPYAVQFTRDTLTKMTEWAFLHEDFCDTSSTCWAPDEEPRQVMIDSWAQGVLFSRDPCAETPAEAAVQIFPAKACGERPVVGWSAEATRKAAFNPNTQAA